MLEDWIATCLRFSQESADFYSGARKILRGRQVKMKLGGDIELADAGYTKSKLTLLKKYYLNQESVDAALGLWEKRLSQGKYGSVGISCYNHFAKGNIDGKSKRGSIFGPCIQSVILTLMNDRSIEVDVFYRSTELFKKFPADLVFLYHILLKPFNIPDNSNVTFHFANTTIHPMYGITIFPLLSDPIRELKIIKRADPFFHDWLVKWSARYVCDEHHRGIAKFAQAMRVCKDARERIPKKAMPLLQKYLRDNHPGHRSSYAETQDDGD
jgi:hypothetical protein